MRRFILGVRDCILRLLIGRRRLREIDALEARERELRHSLDGICKSYEALQRDLVAISSTINAESHVREIDVSTIRKALAGEIRSREDDILGVRKAIEDVSLLRATDRDVALSGIENVRGAWHKAEDVNKWSRFLSAYSEWWSFGASDALMRYFGERERYDEFWDNTFAETWLIFACCLLERGQSRHAFDVVKKVSMHYGPDQIFRFLPLMSLPIKDGIANHNQGQLAKSTAIWEMMSDQGRYERLRSYLQNKKIAVVGNSNCELDKKRGAEIDGHDVIFRFNDYYGKYPVSDYGGRTDVWCRNGAADMMDCSGLYANEQKYKFVLWMDDYLHSYIQGDLQDKMYRDFTCNEFTALAIPSSVARGVRDASGLLNPTSGAFLLWWLKEMLGDFHDVDFYGFSFLTKSDVGQDEHGDLLLQIHSMSEENVFLKQLVANIK